MKLRCNSLLISPLSLLLLLHSAGKPMEVATVLVVVFCETVVSDEY